MSIEVSIAAVTVVITFIILCSASYSDYRSREVSDLHWAAIGGVGLVGNLIALTISGSIVQGIVFLISGTMFLMSVMGGFGKADNIFELLSLIIAGMTAYLCRDDLSTVACSLSVLFGGLYHLFYIFGIVRGGADAKCLMSIGFVLPCYTTPVFGSVANVPDLVELVIVPSFSVLFTASIISVAGCGFYCMMKNIGSETGLRFRIHTYPAPLEGLEKKFVWPAERPAGYGGGSCKAVDDDNVPDMLEQFRREGRKTIRVTPMVPFIIPMTVAFAAIILFGSPLFIL